MSFRAPRHLCRSMLTLCLSLGAMLFTSTGSTAWSQSETPASPLSSESIAELHSRASEFERGQKWGEAVELYDKGSKAWPDTESLKKGLRRCKVQYSIDRRYSDRSFLDRMLVISEPDALAHLDDVLAKIRQQYVDDVSTWSLVAHGTESLYMGLANAKFQTRNLPDADPARVIALRRTLVNQYWNRRVTGIDGARAAVIEVAQLCKREVGLPMTATILEFAFGGCQALDDYSCYLTPGRLDDLYNNIEGEFVGIGIEMKAEAGKGLLLVNVLPESPADDAGVHTGDFITSINSTNCRQMTTEEAANLLQGVPASRVSIEFEEPEGVNARSATLTRRAVKVRSIPTIRLLDATSKIGYIRMTGFQKGTSSELDTAMLQLRREGMQALIWDVRGNPGGLLTAAVEVLDRFVEEGTLVSTKGRMQDQNWTYSAHKPGTWTGPMVLLVDGDSASASEIVAGAVRDHHRGTIVGRRTYGKWSVQSILPGREGTGLRLTTAKFYSPADHTYDKRGVEPDVEVKLEEVRQTAYRGRDMMEKLKQDRDVQTGLELLRKQLASSRLDSVRRPR